MTLRARLPNKIDFYIPIILIFSAVEFNILKPEDSVRNAFKEPNPALALLIVFLAGLGGFATVLILGVQLNAAAFILNSEVRIFARLIAFFAILALVSRVLRREWGELRGLLSALSLLFLVNLVSTIVLTLGLALFVSRQAIQAIVLWLSSRTDVFTLARTLQLPGSISFPGLIIMAIAALLLLLLNFIIFYYTIRQYLSLSSGLSLLLALLVPLLVFILLF